MPTFYSNNTTIQLSTASLQKSTTPNPLINKSTQSTKNIESALDQLTKGSLEGTLSETAVEDEVAGSTVRFLGKHRDMPFLMVRAGEGFFDQGSHGRSIKSVAKMDPKTSGKQAVTNVIDPTGLEKSNAQNGKGDPVPLGASCNN